MTCFMKQHYNCAKSSLTLLRGMSGKVFVQLAPPTASYSDPQSLGHMLREASQAVALLVVLPLTYSDWLRLCVVQKGPWYVYIYTHDVNLYVSVYIYTPIYLSIYLSVYLSVYLSEELAAYLGQRPAAKQRPWPAARSLPIGTGCVEGQEDQLSPVLVFYHHHLLLLVFSASSSSSSFFFSSLLFSAVLSSPLLPSPPLPSLLLSPPSPPPP